MFSSLMFSSILHSFPDLELCEHLKRASCRVLLKDKTDRVPRLLEERVGGHNARVRMSNFSGGGEVLYSNMFEGQQN